MAHRPLRVGIVGCGVIAPTHIESFQQIDGVEVAWVCDLIAARAQATADRYGITTTTTDYHELLADPNVDLVSICTDHASHSPIAVAAFAAGKHVLCEKCLAADQPQLDAMLAAHAARPELAFAGVFQHRFDPINRKLRDLVAAGDLGKMLTGSVSLRCHRPDSYYADDWHGTWAREGGSALINQGIHFLDVLQWVMGGVEAISARHTNRVHGKHIETEDTLVATVQFTGGALGTVAVTSGSHIAWEHVLSLHGDRASIELRNDRIHQLVCRDEADEPRLRAALESAGQARGVTGAADHYGTGHAAQIHDLIDAIRAGRDPYVTGESAAQTAALVFAAYTLPPEAPGSFPMHERRGNTTPGIIPRGDRPPPRPPQSDTSSALFL